MNTKSLLLFIAFFLLINQSISSGNLINQSHQIPLSEKINFENINAASNESGVWNFNMGINTAIDADHQGSDDDCKFHLFHFNRYAKRRTKWLYCLIFKMILITAYMSSFIVGFLSFQL